MTFPTTPGTIDHVRSARIRRLLAIPLIAATAFATTVPVAAAGTDESITTKRGSASFNHKDEILTANDKLKDGMGVQAFLFWKVKKKTVSVTVTDGNGANNSPNTKNLRIREGTKVNLKLCYVDDGIVKKCSRVQTARA